MTEAVIHAAAAVYRAGHGTIESISKEYGVSPATLKRHFKKLGIKKGDTLKEPKALAAAIEETVQKGLVAAQMERITKIVEARENTRKAADFVQRLTLKILTDAVRANLPPSTTLNDMRALVLAAAVLKTTQSVQFEALGVVNDNIPSEEELPQLAILEMGPEEIKQAQLTDKMMGDDAPLPNPELPPLEEEEDGMIAEGEPPDAPD